MAGAKLRVYELAKELGLENKALIALLETEFKTSVKSHASSVEEDLAAKVRAHLKSGGSKASKAPQAEPAVLVKAEKKPPAAEKKVEKVKPETKPTARKAPAKTAPAAAVTPAEDDPIAEVITPPKEDDPYIPLEKEVERHQKTDTGKTAFKKAADVNQEVKPIQPAAAHKDHGATAVATPEPQVAEKAPPAAPALPSVDIEGPMTILELAGLLKKRETELIRHLFMKGVMVTVNQTMQAVDAAALAGELGFDAKVVDKSANVDQYTAPALEVRQAKGKHLKQRAPVVSIMGHVDHGKTSLLDAIRQIRHKIVDTEAGGITQRIGAYTVEKDDHRVVFLDTPGHEAFTAMRMRGAQATDIAILVVAADDGVMPQTIEAINHAKAANIPIIVAINKIDKADADPDRVLVQLSEYGLTAEKWGGDTLTVEVSALQQLGIDDLLETILLVSELQELKADPTLPAEGVVIEAHLDKGKGPVATVLVQTGSLNVGEYILMNHVGGRVRALINDSGERVNSAGPSTPVEVLGLKEVPQAGDTFIEVRNDKEFKRLLSERQNQEREQRLASAAPGLVTDNDVQRQDFYLVVKADTQGSVEALSQAVLQLATEEVSVNILHAGTGDVSEADVLLASASTATIIAFNVKSESNAQKVAQDQGIDIQFYDVIYHVTEEMTKRMLGLLSPETEELEVGTAEVRQLFTFDKTTIAGCYVLEGKVLRNAMARVFRKDKEVFKGTLNNLKRFKDDAKEVASGYECGISFDRYNDLQEGDLIRVYQTKEVERTSL